MRSEKGGQSDGCSRLPPPALSLSHISRRFEGVLALDDVSVTFRPGAVHGVLGENGAGKTTLMRVAAGLCMPDAGRILIDDCEIPPGSPRMAMRAGIAMVHQHFMLVPTLTMVENCMIGRREAGGRWNPFFSRRAAARRIRAIGERIGLEVDPFARVETLSVGQQQRVEIVRALSQAGRVLILDEPTAVLTPQETEQLFAAIDRLRREGMAIVFISHKLDEVERICDELTILRRGRVVYAGPAGHLSQGQMAEYMVGEAIAPLEARSIGGRAPPIGARSASEGTTSLSAPSASEGDPPSGGTSGETARGKGFPPGEVREGILAPAEEDVPAPAQGILAPAPMEHPDALRLIGVHAEDPVSHRAIRDITFAVRPGEILGIAGVEGNGQDVLAAVIVGTLRVRSGQVLLAGHDISGDSIRARAAAGLAHIAEDRLRQALAPDMSLPENLILKAFRSPAFARAGFLRRRAIRAHAERQLERFDVRAGSITAQARHLSGGNQQKLVLARELSAEPRLIVAHNPVRGLDVAATRFVFERLLEQRSRGAGILLIHSDLDELLSLADRVGVLYNGRLTLTTWPACDRAEIGRLMLGGNVQQGVN